MPAPQKFTPLCLALTYAAVSSAWICVTDLIACGLTGSSPLTILAHSAKGLAFVGITSVLLHSWAKQVRLSALAETSTLSEAQRHAEHLRRMYATLSAVNRQIVKPTDRVTLIQSICGTLLEPGGFCGAWVGKVNDDGTALTVVAQAGVAPFRELAIDKAHRADDPCTPVAQAARFGRSEACQEIAATAASLLLRDDAVRSCAAAPVQVLGSERLVLCVYSRAEGFFSPDIMGMLTELAADLGYGLEAIAERERRTAAERALRSSEERYRLLAENSHDVIWILSPDLKTQYISPSIKRLLGYSPAEMQQLRPDEFLTPESYARSMKEFKAAMEEVRQHGRMNNRFLPMEQVRADRSRVWTEMHTTNFYDGSGKWIGVLGVTRDITERRAAEQALAAEVARCRAVLDVSVDGIHVLTPDGQLLDANEVFLRERGFTRPMIPSLRVEQWTVEETPEQLRARLESIGEEPVLFETRHRRADGASFAVEARAKRIEVEGRHLVYLTTRDVTERREMEQRLLRSQRLESVGLIASGIAHDLNNVLTPIMLSTGLLQMRYGSEEDEKLLQPIEAAARRGSNIVQQILTFARGAEGQRVAVQPKILLKELSHLIRETFPRNITHQLDVASDTRSINGDPTQLHQVLLNLALNARDAMPEGGRLAIDVRNRRLDSEDLRTVPHGRPGEYVCITVSDTGSGMNEDVLDHLFEPFFTTKPRGRGTGLGLSTVHGLVKSHGGFVEVSSRLGEGSAFRVFLPAAPMGDAVAPALESKPPTRLGRGEHVLIADDEPAILTVLASILLRQGFLPLTASDGGEALTLLDEHDNRIAVVITDVMMPRFDGVRLASEVRRRSPTLPIIAMSGMISPTPEEDVRKQLRDLGVSTILDKPYGEPELLQAIAAALRR